MSDSNGKVTVEVFRDKANRRRTVKSLDRLWTEFDGQCPNDTKAHEKGQRVYAKRLAELEGETKQRAKAVVNYDGSINSRCLMGIALAAMLSAYLNAQATYLGLEVFLAQDGIAQRVLTNSNFPGTETSFATIARGSAILYGIAVPVLVLILFTVAGKLFHRNRVRVAMIVASAGLALLLLSLWHCTESLVLFGLPPFMAFLFALGIDAGLVSLEVGKIFAQDN